MKILITSGATREPIDTVRFISNLSTGRTGAALADFLAEAGHEVEFYAGEGSTSPSTVSSITRYSSFQNLRTQLEKRLSTGDLDYIIHAAAISDYSVTRVIGASQMPLDQTVKLSSDQEILQIELSRNPKLIDSLARFSPTPLGIVAFKLTDTKDERARKAAVVKLFATRGVTHVVHNDLSNLLSGHTYFQLFDIEGTIASASSPGALAQLLHTHALRKPS
ncbi:MAG: phosphopantothenoylcysteine decarboxylase [Bdellovibrionota bacterium]